LNNLQTSKAFKTNKGSIPNLLEMNQFTGRTMAETDAQATTTKNFYKSKASFSQSLSLNQMANLDDK
tara:strand:- start:880 stop:1080 length:201 start_codon:yes stop_codon:yes gene_type:complete